jgi:hypothetical protein
MDTEPTVAPTIEPSDGTIPKKVGRWDETEQATFVRLLDQELKHRSWKRYEPYLPGRDAAQIRSHAQKYFIRHPEHPLNPNPDTRLSADAAGRVAAAVAAAEAAMTNEGGEPPTASIQAFMNQQARSILVQKAAEVGGEDFKARFGEEPQWSQEVARYIYDKGLIGKIDSHLGLRAPTQFLVKFDYGADACQCCGRGVGLGTPAWRRPFLRREVATVKAAAEKAEREPGI